MRILIYATSPLCGSGYASAARYVSAGLIRRGIDCAVYAWNSHVGPILDVGGVAVFPRGYTAYGAEAIATWVNEWGADILLPIVDPWILPIDKWRANHNARVAFWYPVHATPCSKSILDVVEAGDAALCYSQWGTEEARKAGSLKTKYVPLGVDPDIYRPRPREECRAALSEVVGKDLSDRWIVGMVAANASTIPLSRKAFDQALIAFAEFKQSAPDSVFYIHAVAGRQQGGLDLVACARSLGLTVGEDVLFPRQHLMLTSLTDEAMSRIYGAFDVACQATMGEGFGLPVLEAQACGVPVITTDFSSMPELTAYGRIADLAASVWCPDPISGWCAIPHPACLAHDMKRMRAGDADGSQADGLALARSFSWDHVIDDYLLPALRELAPVEVAA